MYENTLDLISTHLARKESRQAIALLSQDPAIIFYHSRKDNSTILYKAVFYQNEKMVARILEYGVDLLAKGKFDQTPLQLAFRIRSGALAALLYHYETRILGASISEKTMQLYREFLEGCPDGWRHEERDIFLTRSAVLSKEKPVLPPKTLERTLKNLGRLHSESKASDGSGSGSDPSEVVLTEGDEKKSREGGAGADLRHRAVFATAAGAPGSAAEALLGEHS